MSKGRLIYVPNVLVEEIGMRKKDKENLCKSKIIEEIVWDARIGKEQKKIMRSFGFRL